MMKSQQDPKQNCRGTQSADEVANRAADELKSLIVELCLVQGLPPPIVLAGMQAELSAALTVSLGGPDAGRILDKAADFVRHKPSGRARYMALGSQFRGRPC